MNKDSDKIAPLSEGNAVADTPLTADGKHHCAPGVRADILSEEDIYSLAPFLRKHPKLTRWVMHQLIIDKCNRVHGTYCYETGAEFSHLLVDEAYKIKKHVYNEEVLNQFKDTPFVTVSNHPMGGLDGILLIDIIGRHRPDFKVMVNLILYHIQAMRPNFIPVDPIGSDDPAKKTVTMQGIRQAIKHVREGHPIGFFPAGAVSKVDKTLHISDREWQSSITRLIQQFKLPVIPVYFHEHNRTWFNILGMIDWRLRTLQLPRELFAKTGKDLHVTFGDPIMPEEIASHPDPGELGEFLRAKTYGLKGKYHD